MRRIALLCALVAGPVWADEAENRYYAIINELRCLVCQNQAIADSNAPLAADLREQVRAQIAAGRTDAEIQRYVTDRYGDFVLYRPPLRARTGLLWFGPLALLLVAGGAALLFARRARHAPAATASAQDVQRVLDRDGS